jgi:hypothetical protein
MRTCILSAGRPCLSVRRGSRSAGRYRLRPDSGPISSRARAATCVPISLYFFLRDLPRAHGALTYRAQVIVAGVKDADDWFPSPRAETTDDILRRGLSLCPELAPPHIREKCSPEQLSVDDVRPLVVEEGCGLRPARRGGIRLEVEWIPAGPNSGTRVPVVFNYGCVPCRGPPKRAACRC